MPPIFPTHSPQLTRANLLQSSIPSPNVRNPKTSQLHTLSKDTFSFGGNGNRKSQVPGYEMVEASEQTDNEVLREQATGKLKKEWDASSRKALAKLTQRKRRLNPRAQKIDKDQRDKYTADGRKAKVREAYVSSGRQAKIQEEYIASGGKARHNLEYSQKEILHNKLVLANLEEQGFDPEDFTPEMLQAARQSETGKRGAKKYTQRALESRIRKKNSNGSGSQASSSAWDIIQPLAYAPIQTP
jgi:hypothetical protein